MGLCTSSNKLLNNKLTVDIVKIKNVEEIIGELIDIKILKIFLYDLVFNDKELVINIRDNYTYTYDMFMYLYYLNEYVNFFVDMSDILDKETLAKFNTFTFNVSFDGKFVINKNLRDPVEL